MLASEPCISQVIVHNLTKLKSSLMSFVLQSNRQYSRAKEAWCSFIEVEFPKIKFYKKTHHHLIPPVECGWLPGREQGEGQSGRGSPAWDPRLQTPDKSDGRRERCSATTDNRPLVKPHALNYSEFTMVHISDDHCIYINLMQIQIQNKQSNQSPLKVWLFKRQQCTGNRWDD